MEFSDLQTFRAVVEQGGVTAAARHLHRVQSSISARLALLEQDLGCRLFERAGKRLALTPEGRHLYERSTSLVREMAQLRSELVGPGGAARLRLGAMESTAAARLPPVLARLRRAQPRLQLSVRTGTTGALREALEAGELDAIWVAGPADVPAWRWEAVYEEELVLIEPVHAAPQEVGALGLITFSPGCAYREVAVSWARSQGAAAQACTEIGSYHALVAAVSAGMGVGVVPRSVLAGLEGQGITVRELPEPWRTQTTWLVTRSHTDSPAVQGLRAAWMPGAAPSVSVVSPAAG